MKKEKFNIFVGYDSNQKLAYDVCVKSLSKYDNVNIFPLKQNELRQKFIYNRPVDELASTEFSLTRFLVPYLSNYQGWSLFCDSDFLFLENVEELFNYRDDNKSVLVVKHNYVPKSKIKMTNKLQYNYPRKNWSSLMLFNNSKCINLTTDVVNTSEPSYLHQFKWLNDDDIGEIDKEWNYLVGYYNDRKPKALHFTDGGPWHEGYENCQYNELWINEYNQL